ncbi:zinc finger protein 12-like [Sitodiplosis mosellana]|uniref:zinc finger protein 12-like n=1 Tax=Sitodiplosis mosellana TaxID=263140 RepID=UPI002444203E|nr:zinc finger protein 12-like [Sitodiplosis mosellana]
MSGGICHLCFEGSEHMKRDFQQNLQNSEIQEFIELFCQFMFNDSASTLDELCMQCWGKLDDFGQFCEKIRGIHGNLVEVTCATGINKLDEGADILEDEIEEHISTEETNIQLPMLAIESDLGDDGDPLARRLMMTPKVIKNLEEQLHFEAKVIYLSDMNFDRISRFLTQECGICKEPFESFDDCNEHYLTAHGRSAFWNCCNLLLETPYDLLDHIKYHESIDVFKCAACSKCFLNSNKLKYHIRRSHLPTDGPFDCSICDKECRSLRLLMNHHKNHIRIDCPHCKKHISAANYDQHVRTAHASQLPKKRKIKKGNETVYKKQRDDDKKEPSGSNKRLVQKDAPGRSLTISIEPNDNGMYECDICNMQFRQISLLFSHRNKVHV